MTPEELRKTLWSRLHGTDERTQAELDWLSDALECVEAMRREVRAANRGAATNEKALQLVLAQRRKLEQELETLRAGVEAYRHYCRTACKARSRKALCKAFQDRGRRCPECPLDDAEEMDAQIEHAGAELPHGDWSMIDLLSRIREAAGDPKGTLMQDDLVERIKDLRESERELEAADKSLLDEDRQKLEQENHDLRNRCNVAEGKLQAVAEVMNESWGVAGWHLNGESATWDEVGIAQLFGDDEPGDSPEQSRTEDTNP